MLRRQRLILIKFLLVISFTALSVFAMINFRDWVNRSEAITAMEHLGMNINDYRQKTGHVPPRSYIDSVLPNLPGYLRLGKLIYRGTWIDINSGEDQILAYSPKKFSSLMVSDGYVVLSLNGTVDWMDKETFETKISQQQSRKEIETLKSIEP
jgi:hypothetical protein